MRYALTMAALLILVSSADVRSQETIRLTTAAAISQAMAHNESVLIAGSLHEGARQHVREVRSSGLPSVSASVNYSRNWLLPSFVFADQNVKIGSDNNITGNLTLRQPLYTGGRVRGGRRQAEFEAASIGYAEERTGQQIAALVEAAIYDHLLAAEILEVNRVALSRARSNLQQVAALHRVGQATEFDLTRARVQVSTAGADSVARASQFSFAEMALKDLLGISLAQQIVVDATYRASTILPLDDLPGLILTALEYRPERQQFLSLLAAQKGALHIAQAGGRPNLDFVANGQMQFQNDALGDASDGDEWRRSWSTGLVLSVPIFDGRRSHAQVAQARQQQYQLELEQERTDRVIEREVRQAWLDLREADGRLVARQGSVGQAEKGLEDAQTRYRTGRGRQLEVLDAQLVLVEAETESARARRDRAWALVQLELATGMLLSTEVSAGDGQG
jgi:outer membrane protein